MKGFFRLQIEVYLQNFLDTLYSQDTVFTMIDVCL